LKIFNVLGKEVSELVNEQYHPGQYEVTFNALNLSSGIYFYQIQMGNFNKIKKMVLME